MDVLAERYGVTVDGLVRAALEEDLGDGDVTSQATIPAERHTSARLLAKAQGVLSGVEIAQAVFLAVDESTDVRVEKHDGDQLKSGDVVLTVRGSARSLLAAERTALNFLGRLSGIATATSRFVAAVAGSGARILDTRKTAPGWRLLEKAAVRDGGGTNHRVGLYDMVLIKENHIRSAGGITSAVLACRSYLRQRVSEGTIAIEVETTTMAEVEEALAAGVNRIMLDNMSLDDMREAVVRINAHASRPEVEASGNMTVERVSEVAATGVDFISVGAITHSARALDLSLLFEPMI